MIKIFEKDKIGNYQLPKLLGSSGSSFLFELFSTTSGEKMFEKAFRDYNEYRSYYQVELDLHDLQDGEYEYLVKNDMNDIVSSGLLSIGLYKKDGTKYNVQCTNIFYQN